MARAICHRSVELVTFLFSASLSMSSFAQNNLLLRKECNSSVPFGECTDGEANAQHAVSVIYSWKATIQYAIPVVMIVLAGPWSDSHGRRRRPLIFLPIIGQIITDSLCLLNVYFWTWPPEMAAIFEAITPGLFGARNMFWVGVISHISDNCPNEMRTLKYGVINAVYTISSLIGTGSAGFVNVRLGFYGAFIIPALLNVAALAIGFFFITDSSQPYDKNIVWLKPKRFFKNYMSVFKRDSKYYAVTLVTLLLCQSVLVGRIAGEYGVTYLFMRYKFKWYEVKYSYFAAFKLVMIFFGTLFSVTVLSYHLKINDAAIGFIACMFDIFAAICYVFVSESWQLYIIPLVDFFHGTALAISSSLTSKIVKVDELGRLNSVQGVFTTLLSIIIVSLYNATYHFTFEHIAGAVFLLNIVLTLPVLIVFVIIYYKCTHLWTKENAV
ncbi:Major facilitator superfamily,Major facilitator superfamily domain [Cinara cedri]|uniref:Major facilitator superfamily,Major facilitator superfamily domain n=1 Tax=Cinara cedri TaxID=506608 RepID=A0A5E4MNZ0_9HEMI|nr:Major facilitator superfamily,Major facilitator superfamily domain [Cinara cedri]